jgi:hypothetical protein
MTPEVGRTILEILQMRDTATTDVVLANGEQFRVFNIAWGYDIGDDFAHVTTNISPDPQAEHTIDFFFISDVRRLIDAETGASLFEVTDPAAS